MIMKKLTLLVLVFVLGLLSLCSCFGSNPGGEEEEGGDEVVIPENFIFGEGSKLNYIYSPDIEAQLISNIESELWFYNVEVRAVSDTSEIGEHELVIGKVNRPISQTAYDRLDRMEKNETGDLRVVIYSDGSSIAIAYDEDREGIACQTVLKYFVDDIISEQVVAAQGVVYEKMFNLYEYYGELDDQRDAEQWAKLAQNYDPEVVNAVKSYMSIYDGEKLMKWLINLFDPSICVCKDLYGEEECLKEKDPDNAPDYCKFCGTGGFYFSNSARDTVGFLPDVESTLQALGLLAALGMGSDYATLLPEWMGEKIAAFTYNLQDPDGFFYHPQWGKDIATSRRSRDFNWSRNILEKYKVDSKYPMVGDVEAASGELTGRFGSSTVTAVSKVVAVESELLVPDHLKTLDAFKDYLENYLDFEKAAYPAGNELGSQSAQITARGPEYVDAMFEHMDKKQNPENGLWHTESNYYGINGLMKISGIYKSYGRTINYADKAALACFDAIMSEQNPSGIVDIWNAWVAISYVLENIRLFSEDGEAAEAELRAFVISNSADAIMATRDKTVKFVRDDGSYSYVQTGNCTHSQSAPVAVPGHSEGDVNGCMIATTQMIGFVFSVLDMGSYRVQLCGQREKAIMLDMIDDLSPVEKLINAVDLSGDPLDFDYDDLGEIPDFGLESVIGDGTKGSKVQVVEDPRVSGGKVLSFNTNPQSYDKINFKHQGTSTGTKSVVFTAEMCFKSAVVSSDFIRIEMGDNSDATGAYRLSFRPMADGSIGIYDNSSANGTNCMANYLGESVEIGEWFKIRMEYYPGDVTEETVRAKVYFNDKLLSISDNFFDYYGKKFNGSGTPLKSASLTRVQALTGTDAEILLDNVHAYYSKDVYVKEELHEDYRNNPYAINVDKVSENATVYDFESLPAGSYPDGFTVNKGDGAADIVDFGGGKALSVSGGASVNIPSERTSSFPNYISVSFDLLASPTATGTVGSVELNQHGKSDGLLNRFTFKVATVNGKKVITVTEAAKGTTITNFNIPFDGTKSNVMIEYYYNDNIILFYIDGELLGMSSEFTVLSKRQAFNNVLVTGNDGMTLDNVTVMHGNKDYTTTMTPKEPSVTHTFDKGLGDVKVTGSGAGLKSVAGNSLVEIPGSGNATVTIPANLRDIVMNVNEIKFDFEFTSNSKTGNHILSVVDASGKKILSFAIGQNNKVGYIYENTALGTHKTAIAEFDATKKNTFVLEFYEIEKLCKIFINGEYVAASTLLYSADNASLTPASLKIESTVQCAGYRIDNIVFDRLRKGFIKETAANKEDNASVITFGYSGGNNYPADIKAEINSSAALPFVTEMIKGGELDKIVQFDTRSGGADYFILSPTETTSGRVSDVFEAEVMFEENSLAPFQFWIRDGASNIVTVYYLEVKSGQVYFYTRDTEHKDSERVLLGNLGEWINFKVEYYFVDGAPKMKAFVNGEFKLESSCEYARPNMSKLGSVAFYGLSGGDGTMYIDNVSLKESTKAYTAEK